MKFSTDRKSGGGLVASAMGIGAALLAALWAPASIAQGDPAWQRIVAAAKKEGSVVIYFQAVPPVMDRLVKDFMAMYPEIKVEAKRQIQPAQHMSVIENEKRANMDGADVSQYSNAIWHKERASENFFMKPVGPANAEYPKEYLLYGAVPIIAVMPFVMVYNTNLIKTPVTSFKDFLKPEYKGKLGISVVQSIVQVAWYEWLEKTQGADFLGRLAAQAPKIYTGAVPNAQSTASGEIAITLFSVPTVVMPLIERGAPMKMVIPQPALGIRYAGGIIAGSKRPNASQVLTDYLMSPRGQAIWHSRGESASPLPNIPSIPDANSIQPFDPSVYNANSVSEYKKKFDAAMKR